MVPHFFKCFVGVSVVPNGTVVRTKHEGVFFQALLFETPDDFSDASRVGRYVSTGSWQRFRESAREECESGKSWEGREEERVVLVFDPFPGFQPICRPGPRPKAGGVATGVEPDPADSIVDGGIVPVGQSILSVFLWVIPVGWSVFFILPKAGLWVELSTGGSQRRPEAPVVGR